MMNTQSLIDLMTSEDIGLFDKVKTSYQEGQWMGKITTLRYCLLCASIVGSECESLGDDAGFHAAEKIAADFRVKLEETQNQ